MAEAAGTPKAATTRTRKPRRATAGAKAARKPATRKPVARKRAKKPAATVSAKARKANIARVSDSVKEVAYAQLGICGKFYDELNARVSRARKDAPKQWNELVRRGERVQQDFDKARDDLRSDLKKRVKRIDVKTDFEERFEKVRDRVRKFTDRVKKAA